MRESLQVTVRKQLGSRQTRKLRASGQIPAILYGHKEENVALQVPTDQVFAVVRHGGRLVDLKGDVTETALIRQVQWDAYGVEVLHLDLSRVSAGETVEITLPIELKGEAPGAKEGGVIEHVKHEARIRCPVLSIPEKLFISVNGLHKDQALTLGQVMLPEGAALLTDADEIVVHCVPPASDEEAAGPAEPGEPEVIGRKKGEEGEGEEE